ncbi:MAG: pH regulation protein F [Labilithrix sp.]|nr:pH regulation protein F [Labilithrix sp.]
MHEVRVSIALFLLLTVLAGLVRVARGPVLADRILVTQLFGTTGVAILLLLAADPGRGSLRDVALVVALLAAVNVITFVRLAANGGNDR